MNKKIFVLGSLNQDLCVRVSRMPKAGETLAGDGFFANFGGKGANQAAACGKSGAQVYMIGSVGGDLYGAGQIENLKAFGVNTEFIKAVDGVSTGTAVIVLTKGNNRIILDKGANAEISFSDFKRPIDRLAACGDILIGQLEIPIRIAEEAFVYAKSKGLTTLLNPAPAAALSERFLRAVDIMIPNETETAFLTGAAPLNEKGTAAAAEYFFKRGIQTVILTLGSRGAAVLRRGAPTERIPAFKVKAVDTTAAGDTFIGAFAACLSQGKSLSESVKYANAAAALSVTAEGAQQSIPRRVEIERFLNGS